MIIIGFYNYSIHDFFFFSIWYCNVIREMSVEEYQDLTKFIQLDYVAG